MVLCVPRYLFLFLIPISSDIGGNVSGSIKYRNFNESVRVSTCHTTPYIIGGIDFCEHGLHRRGGRLGDEEAIGSRGTRKLSQYVSSSLGLDTRVLRP